MNCSNPNCGELIPDSTIFCHYCGVRAYPSQVPPAQRVGLLHLVGQKRFWGLGAALLIGGYFLFLFVFSSDSGDAEQFLISQPQVAESPVPTITAPTVAALPEPTPAIAVPAAGGAALPQPSDVYSAVSKGVVLITTPSGTGSGFVVDSQGFVVTNAHVVGNYDQVWVDLTGGERYRANVLEWDEQMDLAYLEVVDAPPLPALAIGNSDQVRLGETAYAIGYPLADILGLEPTITGDSFPAGSTAISRRIRP